METIIKLTPAELNAGLLDRIRTFIGEKENIEVTISLKDVDGDYEVALSRSIEQAENGELISFNMEEFMNYTPMAKN